jgi:Icc-related predicted phosphoesterase
LNRVAIITDIHGNLPVLEASLQAIEAIGVDATYCGGDLVGYGPHPNEVGRLIEDRGIAAI